MKSQWTSIERQIETLVEGTFIRLFAQRLYPQDVSVQLARALEDSAARGAPAKSYRVHLHPDDAQILLNEQPDLAEALAEELVNVAREANLTLTHKPEVFIQPDAGLKLRSLMVTVENDPESGVTPTRGMSPVAPDDSPAALQAFLILDGQHTVPLTKPLITLGRRLNNPIILDSPSVSRAHAQLRLRYGRYVIYDLGSTGGTFVNGQRVEECVLRPGDVISLADMRLIYGEDEHLNANPNSQIPNPNIKVKRDA